MGGFFECADGKMSENLISEWGGASISDSKVDHNLTPPPPHTHTTAGHSIFEDTRLLRKLAIPICRHLLRHSCIVFTQNPQSQLVGYTVIIDEQTVITVSDRVYISMIKS